MSTRCQGTLGAHRPTNGACLAQSEAKAFMWANQLCSANPCPSLPPSITFPKVQLHAASLLSLSIAKPSLTHRKLSPYCAQVHPGLTSCTSA